MDGNNFLPDHFPLGLDERSEVVDGGKSPVNTAHEVI